MSGFTLLFLITALLLVGIIFLYVYWKPSPPPAQTSYVKVILKGLRTGKQHQLGIIQRKENIFIILVLMKNGVIREFEVCEQEYYKLEEGMTGLLVWSENRFISFEEF